MPSQKLRPVQKSAPGLTHLHNKNSNMQGSSPDVVKVIFHYHKELHASGSKILSFKSSSNLKRDIIVENHYLIQ